MVLLDAIDICDRVANGADVARVIIRNHKAFCFIIFTLPKTAPNEVSNLQVENKFAKDLVYKLELRSLSLKRTSPLPVVSVVAGKLAREKLPPFVEELAAYLVQVAYSLVGGVLLWRYRKPGGEGTAGNGREP